MPRRRLLLVEHDASIARIIARELGRRHQVLVVGTVARALRALEEESRIDVVVSAYRLAGTDTASRLLKIVARRWPRLRRLIYVDGPVRAGAREVADAVIKLPGSFDELLAAIDG